MTSKTLTESSKALVASDGAYKAVLITPGKGSSGYYSEEMLREYGPSAFPKGTHGYLNHLGEGEYRSPDKLTHVLTEDAYYDEEMGGLVAKVKPMKHWAEFVQEVAPYVGLSISADGTGEMQEMDGEQMFVVESLLPHVMNSVDLVSYAGRGGKIAETLAEQAIKSAHSDSSAGTGKEGNETMATLEEAVETLANLAGKVDGIVSAQETAEAVAVSEAETEAKIAEAVKAAVAATRQVAEAGLSEKLAEKLYAQIETGDFAVEEKLAEYAEIVSEVKEHLEESLPTAFLGSFSSDRAGDKKTNYAVGSWGKH